MFFFQIGFVFVILLCIHFLDLILKNKKLSYSIQFTHNYSKAFSFIFIFVIITSYVYLLIYVCCLMSDYDKFSHCSTIRIYKKKNTTQPIHNNCGKIAYRDHNADASKYYFSHILFIIIN